MEDFVIFTDQIEFTKPLYKNVLHKLVYEAPTTPHGPNYQSGHKLLAEECSVDNDDVKCAFHLSEAVSSSMRMMAVYRDEQIKSAGNKLQKITSYLKPINDLTKLHPFCGNQPRNKSKADQDVFDLIVTKSLKKLRIEETTPFHKQYLKFSKDNNVENFQKILKELPKEWTVIQLTAPYNPNENLKPIQEYRQEIHSLHLSVFTNDYLDDAGPFTINIPANVTKEGEKPLFTELYSILEENYKTIDNAQSFNNKRLVQNYWNRREDIDLRIMSVINVMDRNWLGGWGCLLTGRLADDWREKVVRTVDAAIADWGFIRLTKKQRILLYNLIDSCPSLSSHQIKSCLRRILTEHGDVTELRQVLLPCDICSKDFVATSELCLKCLSQCFEAMHKFSLVDGIRAFSQVALEVKEGVEWGGLKKAKRHPVILIVDEILDTFPWETLPVLKHHPVSRIENIHVLYYLYKIHQSRVVDGYFETKGDVGRYVINPDKNLDRMEKRMSSFVEYWCGAWRGQAGAPPSPQDFTSYLTDSHIFLYCGHGDGCHFANGGGNGGAGVEVGELGRRLNEATGDSRSGTFLVQRIAIAIQRGASGAQAVCILSGCGSVRLVQEAGRAPPTGAHRKLHIAGSPTVVGMLWEVTDLEVDKVVTTLLSLFVPSYAAVPWPAVGKTKWSQGELDTTSDQKAQSPFVPERDLLRAIARSRSSSNYVMIASSVVARGLPVRIRE